MKLAVKSALAGAAIAVAATFSTPMAHSDVSTDTTGTGTKGGSSYGSASVKRESPKHEPGTKTSRQWGPSQFG